MKALRLLLLVASVGCVSLAMADDVYRNDFNDANGWEPQAGWQANPSAQATVISKAGVAEFSTPEPGRGMKWLFTLEGPIVRADALAGDPVSPPGHRSDPFRPQGFPLSHLWTEVARWVHWQRRFGKVACTGGVTWHGVAPAVGVAGSFTSPACHELWHMRYFSHRLREGKVPVAPTAHDHGKCVAAQRT